MHRTKYGLAHRQAAACYATVHHDARAAMQWHPARPGYLRSIRTNRRLSQYSHRYCLTMCARRLRLQRSREYACLVLDWPLCLLVVPDKVRFTVEFTITDTH